MEEIDDRGLVYYRESFRLRSPPGYEKKKEKPIQNVTVTLQEGSLFNMCLKYIILNINLLDSLIGFPDMVGKQLFKYICSTNALEFENLPLNKATATDQQHLRTLTLFSEAYGIYLLKSLSFANLKEDYLVLQPLLNCFRDIVELDLSNMKLENDVLAMFSQFSGLEKLILRNNHLTNTDVMKLTLPYRLYKERSKTLNTLDLSENPDISNASIESLLVYQKLSLLNLSCTNIKMNFSLVYELKQFGWQISRQQPIYEKVLTHGWAEPVISQIICKANNRLNIKDTKVALFYKREKHEKPITKVNTENYLVFLRERFPDVLPKFNTDVLKMTSPLSMKKGKKLQNTRTAENSKKQNTNNPNTVRSKRKSYIFGEHDDDNEDFINQYAKYNSSKPPKKKSLLTTLYNDV